MRAGRDGSWTRFDAGSRWPPKNSKAAANSIAAARARSKNPNEHKNAQGARLIGIYDSQVTFGQSRVLLVWTRLIMPNGRSIVLERQPGADTAGYAGLEDRVYNHWGKLFRPTRRILELLPNPNRDVEFDGLLTPLNSTPQRLRCVVLSSGGPMFDPVTAALLRAVLDEVCETVSLTETGARTQVASKILEAATRRDTSPDHLKQVGRQAPSQSPTMWR